MEKFEAISHATLLELKDKCRKALQEPGKGPHHVLVDAKTLYSALQEITWQRWDNEILQDFGVIRAANNTRQLERQKEANE